MKLKKKIFSMLICFVMCINMLSMVTFAASVGDVIDGSKLTHEQSAQDTKPLIPENSSINPGIDLYGKYLSSGSVLISDEGNGVVYISGTTNCYTTCKKVSVSVYLERLVNGSWQTVSSRSHTSTNTYFTSYGISLAVKKGYYYRVVGSHSVTHNGITEANTTATNAIYID